MRWQITEQSGCVQSAVSLWPDDQTESEMIQVNIADSAMTNVNCEITAPQSFKLSVLLVGPAIMFLASRRSPEKDQGSTARSD
jgi:hypothetical protein